MWQEVVVEGFQVQLHTSTCLLHPTDSSGHRIPVNGSDRQENRAESKRNLVLAAEVIAQVEGGR